MSEITIRLAGDADVAAIAWLRRQWTEEDGRPRGDPDFERTFGLRVRTIPSGCAA